MSRARQVTTTAVLLVAGAATYALWPTQEIAPARNEAARHGLALPPEQISDSSPEQVIVEARAVELAAAPDAGHESADERALMAELHALGTTAPERSLQIARAGNALFPSSPHAAERAWFVVRSLDSLGRFHEARDEARTMVERYRGSSWAADVERHTLVYPLDQPSREEMQAREHERDL
jgi:hypothetical protein